jgi:hypothetical protein
LTAVAVEHGASFERVLGALEGAGRTVRRGNGSHQAMAQCPVHADGKESLSVTWKNGKTLLHCFNGCTDGAGGKRSDPSQVLAAIGLGEGDMFDEARPRREDGALRRPRRRPAGTPAPQPATPVQVPTWPTKTELLGKPVGPWKVIAEYIYTDEHGQPLGKVIRKQRDHEHGYDKRFLQRHWIGQCPADPCTEKRGQLSMLHASGWGLNAPARKVLYQLPALVTAIEAGREVWLPEGEKDADALNFHFERAGYEAVATANASGARSWREEYAQALAGAHVVIVEDIDPPGVNRVTGEVIEPAGRTRTKKLLASLAGVAASVRVVRAIAGKDSFDHLSAGHAARDFEPVTLPAGDGPGDGEPAAGAPGVPAPGWARRLADQTGTSIEASAETVLSGDPGDPFERGGLRLVRDGDDAGGGGGGPGGGQEDGGLPNRRTRYLVRHGELVKYTKTRDGAENYDVILGCSAEVIRVDQKIVGEDQAPATTGYLLRLEHPAHPGETREVSVGRKAWDSGEWLSDLPWTGVQYDSSRNGIAKVRDAIRTTSPVEAPTVVHGAPGWIRDRDGNHLYVHAGGAIGADGPADVAVDLGSKLDFYRLPAPPASAEELRAAADYSLGLIAELPARIGAPLAGVAYRAAVSRMGPPVTAVGPPESLKTSMCKVTLHHFAPDLPWDTSVLSLSERGATGNAGAALMHLTRDTLLLADDAAPDRSLKAAAERVGSIVRLQYNGEVRDRLDRESNLQRPTPPRGSLIVSAEIGPSATSAVQRTLIVPFIPGLISRDTRVALWEAESRHGRAVTMASFIRWQAGQREAILARTADLLAEYGQAWTEAGHSERTAEALAHLAAGWRLMLDHLAEAGAYTDSECAVIWEAAWAGLDEAGRTQANPDEPADAAGKVLSRLRTGLLGRYGYLTGPDGGAPDKAEATRYGWTVDTVSRSGLPGDQVTVVSRPHGADPVGCYAGDGEERRLWLVPELTLIMLRKVSGALGEPFEETVMSVSSALEQAGIGLAVTKVKSTGITRRAVQRPVPGSIPGARRPWVWDIPESALYDAPPAPGGEDGPGSPPAPGAPPAPQDDSGPDGDGNVSSPRFDGGDTPGGAPAGETPHAGSPQADPAGQPPQPRQDMPAADSTREDQVDGTQPRLEEWPPGTIGAAVNPPRRPRQPAPSPPAATRPAAPPAPMPARPAQQEHGGQPGQPAAPDGAPPAAPRAAPAAGTAPARPAAAAGTWADRWRAPAAVLDADGIYLPGGERLPLPDSLPHAGALGDLPARLNLGHGGGKTAPFTGQLWLTAAFCEQVAGLPLPGPGITEEERAALLAEAAGRPWLTAAVEAGWQVSDASRERLGHRMRIWRDGNKAGAQIVFVPYITGEVALLDRGPAPAALAARLERYAQLAGVPFGRSAAYSGHDLIAQVDARRKKVQAGPASPPPAAPSVSGLVSFQRRPGPEEENHRYLHSYDATAAWLAAAKGTELGIGAAVHKDKPLFDPRLIALWRVRPPAWDTWRVPDPLRTRHPRRDGTVWAYTPLLAFEAEVLGAEIEPLEAWVWPEHTRYLDLWAQQIDAARLALAGPPPSWRPGDPDDAAVLAAVKDTYSGAVTLFGSPQLDASPDKLILLPRLLELARRDGAADASLAELRRRYCRVRPARDGQERPCASCGKPSSELVGGIPLHPQCPDPDGAEGGGQPRSRLFRPDWAHMISNTAAARLYRKVFAAAAASGRWPVGADRDNLLYTSDDPDPERSCPDGLVPSRPGQEKAPVGNRLGQVKCKGSALMADAAPLLADGKFHFDKHLTGRDSWEPANGDHGGQ